MGQPRPSDGDGQVISGAARTCTFQVLRREDNLFGSTRSTWTRSTRRGRHFGAGVVFGSFESIYLVSARAIGSDLRPAVTYGRRMEVAASVGFVVEARA